LRTATKWTVGLLELPRNANSVRHVGDVGSSHIWQVDMKNLT